MSHKKSEMEPVETGNSVLIPIHRRGNPTDIENTIFIQEQIKKWKGNNPLKQIMGTPETIFIPASSGRVGSVSSVKFVWEPLNPHGTFAVVTELCFVKNSDCRTITFVVRSNSYCTQLSWFNAMYKIACIDFPNLSEDQVVIKIYNNDRHKGHTGIEFTLPETSVIPSNYVQVNELEQAY